MVSQTFYQRSTFKEILKSMALSDKISQKTTIENVKDRLYFALHHQL